MVYFNLTLLFVFLVLDALSTLKLGRKLQSHPLLVYQGPILLSMPVSVCFMKLYVHSVIIKTDKSS